MGAKVKMNSKGAAAALKDPKVIADLLARAERIAAAAGPRHEGRVHDWPKPSPRVGHHRHPRSNACRSH